MGLGSPNKRFLLRLRGAARLLTAAMLVALVCAACGPAKPTITQQLDASGMSYDAIKQLKGMKIAADEVPQMAQARQSGLSDDACVQVMQIYRSRKQTFDAGGAIAGLLGAGGSENLVLSLARLNQLGLGAGELEAMRLAGLSDEILLAVAQRHASGEAVLSGASLASMKNLGMSSNTLLELVQHGVPDSQAAQIMSARKHGAKDAQILRDFATS